MKIHKFEDLGLVREEWRSEYVLESGEVITVASPKSYTPVDRLVNDRIHLEGFGVSEDEFYDFARRIG